jgi:hypothetical protein
MPICQPVPCRDQPLSVPESGQVGIEAPLAPRRVASPTMMGSIICLVMSVLSSPV